MARTVLHVGNPVQIVIDFYFSFGQPIEKKVTKRKTAGSKLRPGFIPIGNKCKRDYLIRNLTIANERFNKYFLRYEIQCIFSRCDFDVDDICRL